VSRGNAKHPMFGDIQEDEMEEILHIAEMARRLVMHATGDGRRTVMALLMALEEQAFQDLEKAHADAFKAALLKALTEWSFPTMAEA